MRRSAALVSAVALVAAGVALAAPANAAAPLKPGAPTSVKAVPTNKGTAVVTWKAPVVKKGKTAKATAYTVACTGAAKLTVKTTKATVTIVKSSDKMGYRDNVVCSVSAVAGKAIGAAGKSAGFTAYSQKATATFTLTGAGATSLGSKLGVKAPATFNKSTLTITLPVTGIQSVANPSDTLYMAGALIVAGVPMPSISVVPDATTTSTVKVEDLVGKTSIGTIPVLQLTNFQTVGMTTTFNVSLTSNPQVVGLLSALGITATAGEALGTGSIG